MQKKKLLLVNIYNIMCVVPLLSLVFLPGKKDRQKIDFFFLENTI